MPLRWRKTYKTTVTPEQLRDLMKKTDLQRLTNRMEELAEPATATAVNTDQGGCEILDGCGVMTLVMAMVAIVFRELPRLLGAGDLGDRTVGIAVANHASHPFGSVPPSFRSRFRRYSSRSASASRRWTFGQSAGLMRPIPTLIESRNGRVYRSLCLAMFSCSRFIRISALSGPASIGKRRELVAADARDDVDAPVGALQHVRRRR